MVKNLDNVEAYQWESNEWQKIGEVTNAVGSPKKKMYQNQEYDFIFDIDVAEGAPPLKLPYNITGRRPSFFF